jgi:hypothetical protein
LKAGGQAGVNDPIRLCDEVLRAELALAAAPAERCAAHERCLKSLRAVRDEVRRRSAAGVASWTPADDCAADGAALRAELALDSPGGDSGLLVDEELARAVRHESVAAVRHWWGESGRAVWALRQALGVTRTANEGTARLVRASAGKGAESVRGWEWTADERDRRRQLNAAKGLARNPITGYLGAWWTAEDIALLGTVPDEEIARRTGRAAGAVRRKRGELGIPNPAGNRWRADEIALPGRLPGSKVAEMVGRSVPAVIQKRIKLGIRNRWDRRRVYDL